MNIEIVGCYEITLLKHMLFIVVIMVIFEMLVFKKGKRLFFDV